MKTKSITSFVRRWSLGTLLLGTLVFTVAPLAIWKLTALAQQPQPIRFRTVQNATGNPESHAPQYFPVPPMQSTINGLSAPFVNAESSNPLTQDNRFNSSNFSTPRSSYGVNDQAPPGYQFVVDYVQVPVATERMLPGENGTSQKIVETQYRTEQRRRLVPVDPNGKNQIGADSDNRAREIARSINAIPESQRSPKQLEQLRKLLDESFKLRLENQQERLTKLSEELDRTREILEQRRSNQVEIVERHMRELLGNPDPMGWDYEPNRAVGPISYHPLNTNAQQFRSADNVPVYATGMYQQQFQAQPLQPRYTAPISNANTISPSEAPTYYYAPYNAPTYSTPAGPIENFTSNFASPKGLEEVISLGYELLKAKTMLQLSMQNADKKVETHHSQMRVNQVTDKWQSRRDSAIRYKEIVTKEIESLEAINSSGKQKEGNPALQTDATAKLANANEHLSQIERQLAWMDAFEDKELAKFDDVLSTTSEIDEGSAVETDKQGLGLPNLPDEE